MCHLFPFSSITEQTWQSWKKWIANLKNAKTSTVYGAQLRRRTNVEIHWDLTCCLAEVEYSQKYPNPALFNNV